VEIARLYKLETFALKRASDVFQSVDEGPDFDCVIGASKSAAPARRLRLRVHIGDENLCVRPRHTREFARQRSRVEDVTDGERAHNNISHARSKRKRKAIGQDEAVPKQRLAGRAGNHLGAAIYPHHRTGAAAK